MRAVLLHQFGPPECLVPVDVPDPVPGAGEVLIDVELAGVTFVETQIRAGRPPHPAMAPALPAVLGNGVGGVVRAVGDGVADTTIGRLVVSSLRGTGGYAERAVAPADGLIDVPEGLPLPDAVALLADGRTALLAHGAVQLHPGETALVMAAGGGVGSLLVQLAHQTGGHVVAAAGSVDKLELARSLGAEGTVDYRQEGWTSKIGPVDVVFDGVGGSLGRAAFEQLRPGGRMLRFGMASGAFTDVSAKEATARGVTLISDPPPSRDQLRDTARHALALAAAARLRPTIGQIFRLDRAGDAHAAIESRQTLGKTLLVMP